MNSDSSVRALLDAQLAAAEEWFQRHSDGAAICSFTRAGIAVPGLKYAEGRWSALRQVQRSILRGVSPSAALPTVVGQWTEDLARRRSMGAGPDWIWYRAGGLDALEELADALTRGEDERLRYSVTVT